MLKSPLQLDREITEALSRGKHQRTSRGVQRAHSTVKSNQAMPRMKRLKHPLITVFPEDDLSRAFTKLNDQGSNFLRGTGPTSRDAVLDMATRLEKLAAELRAIAEDHG